MKKILYIIPIVVLAMVGLTQDAKAQNNSVPPIVSGQTGNASNAVTIIVTNTVGINSVVGLGSGNESNVPNALIVVDGTFVQTVNPPTNAPVVIFQGKGGISASFNDIQESPLSSDATGKVLVGKGMDDRVTLDSRSSTISMSGTTTDYSVTVTSDHHALITKFLIGS